MKKKNFKMLLATLTIVGMLVQPLTVFGAPNPNVGGGPDVPAPTNVTLSDVTTSSITISWTAANGVQKYEVISNSPGINTTTSHTSHTFTGLLSESLYSFQVRSIRGSGGGTQQSDFAPNPAIATTTLAIIYETRSITANVVGGELNIEPTSIQTPFRCEIVHTEFFNYSPACALDELIKNTNELTTMHTEFLENGNEILGSINETTNSDTHKWFFSVNGVEYQNLHSVTLHENDTLTFTYKSLNGDNEEMVTTSAFGSIVGPGITGLENIPVEVPKTCEIDVYETVESDTVSTTISYDNHAIACGLQTLANMQELTTKFVFSENGLNAVVGTIGETQNSGTHHWVEYIIGDGQPVGPTGIDFALFQGDTFLIKFESKDPTAPREVTLSVLFNEEEDGMDIVEQNILLPYSCEIKDNEDTVHTISGHKAICVLVAINEAGYTYDVINYGEWGLFLNGIEGYSTTANESWVVYHNENLAVTGISQFEINSGDSLTLEYGPWPEDIDNGDDTTTTTPPVSGGGGGSSVHTFSVRNAVQYIVSFFTDNGSVNDNIMLSDWSAVAFGAAGSSNVTASEKETLRAYLLTDPDPITGPNHTTSYARRAMALMSIGISPFNGTATNYIEKIVDMFDGTQFKDTPTGGDAFVNDDIFALVVLHRAGYTASDEIITKTVEYIVLQQADNGSIGGSADLTAAAIQALQPFNTLTGVSNAIDKALVYLKTVQSSTGSANFGDVPVTSWSLQALGAVGQSTNAHWNAPTGATPQMYLSENQSTSDGGMLGSDVMTRIWETTYAIPGYLARSWDTILLAWTASGTVTDGQNEGSTTGPSTDDTTTTDETTTDSTDTTTNTTTPPTTDTDEPVATPTTSVGGGTTILPVGEVLGERIENEEETTTVETIDRGTVAGDQETLTTTTDDEEDVSWVRRLFVGSLIAALILIIYLAYISRKRDEQ